MTTEQIALAATLPVLLIFSALASASETALFGVTPGEQARLRRVAPAAARAVDSLRARPREMLAQVLLFNMLANTAYFIVTSVLTVRVDGPALKITVSAGSVLAIILFGEVLAKLFATTARVAFLRFAAPVHLAARGLIGPFLTAFDRLVIAPLSRLIVPSAGEPSPVRPEELAELITVIARDGSLRSSEQGLLRSIVDLGTRRVREVMRPRVDLVWAERDTPHDALVELCATTAVSRLPLCVGGFDGRVAGVLDTTRFLAGQQTSQATTPAVFVPELARLDTLLERFRDDGVSAAICVDEHGGVVGMITLAELVDELIDAGQAGDAEDALDVVRTGERAWIVPGRFPVRDLATAFGVKDAVLRAGRATTIAGLTISLLGRFPARDDEARLGDLVLRVAEVHERTVLRVELILREDRPKRPRARRALP